MELPCSNREGRRLVGPCRRRPYWMVASQPVESLQVGLSENHQRKFKLELGGAFEAVIWLIKEFRLHVGYETPDEEAGIRFWIDTFESRGRRDPRNPERQRAAVRHPFEGEWPTWKWPGKPATPDEVSQACCWRRDEVEALVTRLFKVRRRTCPQTPILVPLHHLEHFGGRSAARQRIAALHQFAPSTRGMQRLVVRPVDEKRRALSATKTAPSPAAARGKAVAMAQETKDRLYPVHVGARLTEEQFASRVIDLAIEFEGDAKRATRDGLQFLARGVCASPPGPATASSRRWQEGMSDLADVAPRGLAEFWSELGDKAALGLMILRERAEVALSERIRGTFFAERVMTLFRTRFKYECADGAILYRFWLRMPKAVRSAHHIRGLAERLAYELLRLGARLRAKLIDDGAVTQRAGGAGGAATPRAGGRPAWRPNGEARASDSKDLAQLKVAHAAVVPYAPKSRSLEELARPKERLGASAFLQVLAKQFPHDNALRRMLQQSLDGGRSWLQGSGAPDAEAFDVLHESLERAVQNKIVPIKIAPKGPSEPDECDLHLCKWTDKERAKMATDAIKAIQDTTKKIDGSIRSMARRYLEQGARIGRLGVYASHGKGGKWSAQVSGLFLTDDLFAWLCQKHTAREMFTRFGNADYMPLQKKAVPGASSSAQGLYVALGSGGPTTDCSTRRANCTATSSSPGCEANKAVDGQEDTGWRPEHAEKGLEKEVKWTADLGRLHSCVGVVLTWVLPWRKEVKYPSHRGIVDDIRLSGGIGSPIVVAWVRQSGLAEACGVKCGDVLRLGVGGSGDEDLEQLDPMEALHQFAVDPFRDYQEATLVFSDAAPRATWPSSAPLQKIRVNLWVAKEASKRPLTSRAAAGPASRSEELEPPRFVEVENVKKDVQISTEAPSEVLAMFVARWVRLDFSGPWPKAPNGRPLELSIRVVKAWRLAPAAFRRRLVDTLERERTRQALVAAEKAGKDGCRSAEEKHLAIAYAGKFWARSDKPKSYNLKISNNVKDRLFRGHDFEDFDADLVEHYDDAISMRRPIPGRPLLPEFHLEIGKEARAWRPRIYALEDDARECTFHPRTAGNVPRHIMKARERIGRVEENTDIRTFVDGLGSDFKSLKYHKYAMVKRRSGLQKARRKYHEGLYMEALKKLSEEFGVEQILRRFRCFHKGCNSLLDQYTDICACSGYYCPVHTDQGIHDCKAMKKSIADAAQASKNKAKELMAENITPPKEEDFSNKADLGIIVEVLHLVEAIHQARDSKRRMRHSLETLDQSMAQFGAVRLGERPFRTRMCSTALPSARRSWSKDGGAKVPTIGKLPLRDCQLHPQTECQCSDAHHPSELRFPAGESAARRASWVKEGVAKWHQRSDVLIGSAAERIKIKAKQAEEAKDGKPAPKKRAQRPHSAATAGRTSSEPRGAAALRRSLGVGERDLAHAAGAIAQAHIFLQDGHVDAARQSAAEIRGVACRHVRATSAAAAAAMEDAGGHKHGGRGAHQHRHGGGRAPSPSRRLELRSQIRALAGEATTPTAFEPPRAGRPLRECERQELTAQGSELGAQARKLMEQCTYVEAMAHRMEQQQALEDAALFAPPSPMRASRGQESEVAESPRGRPGERLQMCIDFLDKGMCAQGEACRFAHAVVELSGRSAHALHGLRRSRHI